MASARMKKLRLSWSGFAALLIVAGPVVGGVAVGQEAAPWETCNPVIPIPEPPLGIGTEKNPPATLTDFADPPTPQRVRLGRWLFFDKRLSADNTISCATCHKPENGFSETTPVSTGIGGQKGGARHHPSPIRPGPVSRTSFGMAAPPLWKSRRAGR